MSKQAYKNIENALKILTVDHVDWEFPNDIHRRSTKKTLKIWSRHPSSAMIPIVCGYCKTWWPGYFKVAHKHDVSLMIIGSNPLETASFKELVDKVGYDAAYDRLDQRIKVDGNNVIFELPRPFVPFLGIMADSGSAMGIMPKAWCIEQGAWPGTKETGQDYMNKTAEDDPLFDKMMGTGPFKFVAWERSERVVVERFDDYWQGPAKLQRVIRKIIADIPAGILLLKQGDADFVSVNVDQLGQVEGAPGIKVMKNLPSLWLIIMRTTLKPSA